MTRSIRILAGAALLAPSMTSPAFSQGAPQTVTLMKVGPASLATGYRASKVVEQYRCQRGQRNRGNDRRSHRDACRKVPFAVLSAGGLLGMGSKYVVVPFSSLQVKDKKTSSRHCQGLVKALPELNINTGA